MLRHADADTRRCRAARYAIISICRCAMLMMLRRHAAADLRRFSLYFAFRRYATLPLSYDDTLRHAAAAAALLSHVQFFFSFMTPCRAMRITPRLNSRESVK